MGKEVPKVNTPVSDAQMAQAIVNVWQRLFGATPSKEQVYMVMAQNAVETGANRSGMHNYNVGNIIAGNTNHDYFLGGDWMYADKAETQKKKIVQHFRAYNSLEEGVEDYLKLLSQSKRYAAAWDHIKNPDVRAYSKALHDAGYYGAKEEVYTAGLMGQFNRYNKGNSYSAATSGQGTSTPMPSQQAPTQEPGFLASLENTIQKYLHMIAASDKANKKLYKYALPKNDILIQIEGEDYNNCIEFARILCATLDEELLSRSYTHTDGREIVEVECTIHGPADKCLEVVSELSKTIAGSFKVATKKIGGIEVSTNCVMNKKSFYQPISAHSADTNYRRFLLKFI